jgi:hypothetical protein
MAKIRNKNIGAGAVGGAPTSTGFGGTSTQKAMGSTLPPPPPTTTAAVTPAANQAPAGRPPSPYAKSKTTSGANASGSVFGENAPTSLMQGPAAPTPMPAAPPSVAKSASPGYQGNFGVGGEGAAPAPLEPPLPVVPNAPPVATPAPGTTPGTTPGTMPPPATDKPPVQLGNPDSLFNPTERKPIPLPGPNPYSPGTREFKEYEAQKNEIKDQNTRNGFSLEDMGKFNKKEQGMSSHSAEKALDFYGPAWTEGEVYDLQNGSMHVYGNRGPGGTGPTHDYGDAAIPPDKMAAFQQWRGWVESEEGKQWAHAYGGSPYRGWMVKQDIEKEVKHGNLDRFPGPEGGYTDYGPGGYLRTYYNAYGKPVPPPAGVPLQVAMDPNGHPKFGAPVPSAMPPAPPTGAPTTPTDPGGAMPVPGATPNAPGNVPSPNIVPGTVPVAPGNNVTASSMAVMPQPTPMPSAPGTTPDMVQKTKGRVRHPGMDVPVTPPNQIGVPASGEVNATPDLLTAPKGGWGPPKAPSGPSEPIFTFPTYKPGGDGGMEKQAAGGAMPAAPPSAAGPVPTAPLTVHTITPEHLDSLQPGGTINTPAAVFTRDPLSGRVEASLTPLGQQRMEAAHQQALQRFGPRPLVNDPNAPQPEIHAGRWNYNPLSSGFTR